MKNNIGVIGVVVPSGYRHPYFINLTTENINMNNNIKTKKSFTTNQKKVLNGLWKDVQIAQNKYFESISFIEKQAKHILNIDIEIFYSDGEPVGFGDYNRKYKLYQDINK